jgi:hypothetical protein
VGIYCIIVYDKFICNTFAIILNHLATIFLFTPPFTQLNTPYPATAYLKGFLDTKNISSYQADFGIEVLLQLFSKKGFTTIFEKVNTE